MEEDGRRLLGTVPSATILMVNSTRYKINGAQAIALTDTTSRISAVCRSAFDSSPSVTALGVPWPKRPTRRTSWASPEKGEVGA